MKKLDRILVPTDFSKGAKAAAKYANFLATHFGATVDLMHRLPTVKFFQDSIKKIGVPLHMETDFIPQVEKDAKAKLEKEMNNLIDEGNQGDFFTRAWPGAAQGIVDFAREGKYDLIVMGTRGDSADQYISMGGITTRVVRISRVPVVAVPEAHPIGPVTNIVVPTDYSPESLEALLPAAFMAYQAGARITLFHVLEMYGALADTAAAENSYEKVSGRIIDAAITFTKSHSPLKIAVSSDGSSYSIEYTPVDGRDTKTIALETEMDQGLSAHHQIVTYADEHADLMVLSTHGRSGLPHLRIGSTAEKVTQWSQTPVMINRVRFPKG